MSTRPAPRRVSSPLGVYVILLLSLQVFLVAIAVDALQADDETLAWIAASVSTVLAAAAVMFARYLRTPSRNRI